MYRTAILVVTAGLYLLQGSSALAQFRVEEAADRLTISHDGKPVGEFVFHDEKIRRPFFANLYAPNGARVTRPNPPVAGADAVDHDTMHPGIWLAFGDLNGQDFWRNKGTIEHIKFSSAPQVSEKQVRFSTQSRVVGSDAKELAQLTCDLVVVDMKPSWLIVWKAGFVAGKDGLRFGDQEEMGFGVRMATPLIEKNGGEIKNAKGLVTAAKTWGQPSAWCDYAGTVDGERVGVTLFAGPKNFRESWWHNRDYGLMVANPFGRAAMKQGEQSTVVVPVGETFALQFAVCLHSGPDHDPAAAYDKARSILEEMAEKSSRR
jgi:hypothetical protein